MRWHWWPRHPPVDDAEARAALAKLTERDAEVERLGRELSTARSRNNFSGMVAAAITRSARRGS